MAFKNPNRLLMHPNGPDFSKLSAGLWRLNEWDFSPEDTIDYIETALDAGITTFDHADIYGDYRNESIFGEALKQRPDLRDKMELVSKCGICLISGNRPHHSIQHYDTTAVHIRRSVEQSLKNLHTDYLDLVLIHRPDPLMSASEMADVFMELISEEKIKHVGVSNFTVSQFSTLQSKMDVPLVTNQVECSLLHLDPIYDGTLDQAQKLNFSPMIWSPFAGGRLFHNDHDERLNRVRNSCNELAKKYGATIDQIALAWLVKLPCNPQPVLGTGKTERLRSASESLNIELERQDWYRLLEASTGHPVP
ncbi:MAG: aldo/keto reductase [Balneolaceae bacterium]|nr:aldo/keto reductase [Balneolaceae bacterium]